MIAFFRDLFDTSGFPTRWHCGLWSAGHGWLHILSDIAIFGAYSAIPLTLAYFIRRRKDVPFLPIFWLFAVFIVACGLSHLIEATIFWHPWYRLSGLVKLVTAVVSWMTVFALLKVLPSALALPGMAKINEQLSAEIAERKQAAEALRASDEFNRSLMEGSADCVKVLDLDGHLLHMNAPGRCLMEIDDFGPLCGQHWSASWPAQAREDIERSLAAARGGHTYSFQAFCPTAKGTPRWWDVMVSPIRDAADGPTVRVLSVSRDITGRQRTEEALREKEHFLQRVTTISPSVVYIMDLADLRITWVNAQVATVMGYSVEEVLELGPAFMPRAMHPDDLLRMPPHFEQLARSRDGELVEIEYRLRHPDGTWRWFGGRKTPFSRDAKGNVREIIGTSSDITERKEAEEAVARLAAIVESSHDALFSEDLDGIVTTWNHGAEEIFGYRAEEIIGTSILRLIPAARQAEEHGTQRKFAAGERGGTFGTIRRTKDGREFPASITVSPLKDAAGQVIGTSQAVRDITERKRAEEAVRAAGERFRFLAESMPQKICTATPAGDIDYFNQRWTEFTGLTYQQLKDRGWKEFVHPDDLEENTRHWQHCIDTGDYFELEHRFRRTDGEYRWHLSRAHAMRDTDGKITMWIGSNTDIDDMMRAQEELIDAESQLADRAVQLEVLVAERTEKLSAAHTQLMAEAEERKRLEAEIAAAVEGERERLGQELHDGLVQEITGIGMMLHVLERQMKKPAPEFAGEAARLGHMIEQAQENARNLAKNFYPVELEQHGLLVALEGIAQRARQQHGIACTVQADANFSSRLHGARAVQLFRITQEAVQNATKHSQAKNILIHLGRQNGAWLLTIKDDGIGLPDDARSGGGMGLRILQYRARIIQASLTVTNNADGGVLVSCIAPAIDEE